MTNKAIILAGGLGSRMKKRTKILPKCLLKIGDKPIICYLIDFLIIAGITNIIISTRKEYVTIIENALKKYKKLKINIKIISNNAHKKSATLALLNIVKIVTIKEPFLLLLSDIFYLNYPFKNLDFGQKDDILYGAKPNYLLNTKNEGIIKSNKKNIITEIIKYSKTPSKNLRWSGMAICGSSFWIDLSNCFKKYPSQIKHLENIFQNRINKKRKVHVIKSPNFININKPIDLLLANLINRLWIHKNTKK